MQSEGAAAQRSMRLSRRQAVLFTASRYAGFVMQFAKGVLAARILGPQLFGIWGFITLAQQYMLYSGLGLQYSVTVELATVRGSVRQESRVVGVAMGGSAAIALVLLLIAAGLAASGIPLVPKYRFSEFVLPLAGVVGLTHLRQVLRNAYRVYGSIGRVAATDLLVAALPLTAVLVFRGEALLMALLGSMIAAGALSIVVLLVRPPFRLALYGVREEFEHLLAVGIPLLIYNVSFYLITVAARTVISAFYSVETMGYYSLANTLTGATLLGLNAVAWVVFPDVLARTRREVPDEDAQRVVDQVSTLYGTAVWLAVFLVLLTLPVLFWLLPEYTPVEDTLVILLLAQAVLAASFGYNCVAIARKQQLKVARLSLLAVGTVATLSLGAAVLNLPFEWVAAAVLAGSTVFTLLQGRLGEGLMPGAKRPERYVSSILPPRRVVPLLLILIGALASDQGILWNAAGLALFLLLAHQEVAMLFRFVLPGRNRT